MQQQVGKYTAYYKDLISLYDGRGNIYFEHDTKGEEDCWIVHINQGVAVDYESGEPAKVMLEWLHSKGIDTSRIGY